MKIKEKEMILKEGTLNFMQLMDLDSLSKLGEIYKQNQDDEKIKKIYRNALMLAGHEFHYFELDGDFIIPNINKNNHPLARGFI